MERAGRAITKIALASKGVSGEELVCATWAAAVGKRIALHTRAVGMVRTALVVEVEDFLWQKNLHGLRGQILRNLEELLGPGVVSEVQYILRRDAEAPRRAPQRAHAPPAEGDIADPVLRQIYRASERAARKNGTS